MSANQPLARVPGASSSEETLPPAARARWMLWAALLAMVVGAGVGAGIALLGRGHGAPVATLSNAATPPVATWSAGARPAPDFTLDDQNGKPFSLSGLRGRPVIVTFIDPLCRNFCPLEARVLSDATKRLPVAERPTIVSVSVNPWGDAPGNFREDAVRWGLGRNWRWGAGGRSELARVWRKYEVGVQVTKKVIAGVTVREISHTAAAYVLDRAGNERALFLYPFRVADVTSTLRQVVRSSSPGRTVGGRS